MPMKTLADQFIKVICIAEYRQAPLHVYNQLPCYYMLESLSSQLHATLPIIVSGLSRTVNYAAV